MPLPLLAGNWKMYKIPEEAGELVRALLPLISSAKEREILICPPFTSLFEISRLLTESNVQLGAQNLYPEREGAFTGEVSGPMLKVLGCRYVIIGHSERRQYFGEKNDFLNRKIKHAFSSDLRPIYCVGETLNERRSEKTLEVLKNQLEEGLLGFRSEDLSQLVIAYEPVWAIGTGETATPEQAEEAHLFIRNYLSKKFNPSLATNIRILYGGSVKPDNVDGLMAKPNINGALVGGASLTAESFARIVNFTYNPVHV